METLVTTTVTEDTSEDIMETMVLVNVKGSIPITHKQHKPKADIGSSAARSPTTMEEGCDELGATWIRQGKEMG